MVLSQCLGCWRERDCALQKAFSMRHGGFRKYIRPETDQKSATEIKVTKPLLAGPLAYFSVAARGPKSVLMIFGNCHAKPRGEATRRRRACRCRKARRNIAAPRCGKSAGNVVATPSRKISGDTFT